MELGAVLPGVAAGAGEADGENLVQWLAVRAQKGAQDHFPGGLGGEGPVVIGPENFVADGEAVVAGDAEDAYGGEGVSGGNGSDGVHRGAPFYRSG